MAAIVRVKRRRGEDPAESLLLSCKKARKDEQEEGKVTEDHESATSLFKFATTVTEEDKNITKHVRDAIKKEKLAKEYKQHRSEELIQRSRRNKKEESAKNRLSVIAKKRALDLDSLDTSDDKSQETEIDPETSRLFCLFDVVAEDVDFSTESDRNNTPSTPEVVTCNGVALVREKVIPPPKKPQRNEDDFVYDIYYMNDAKFDFRNLEKILSIEACRDELTFGDDRAIEDEEVYDDEDDPDEECNWRNDYPDEETPFSKDGAGSGDDVAAGVDEDEFDEDRIAAMMEHRLKLNADDYDEYRDLSSDDEDHAYFNEPLGPTTSYESYKARVSKDLEMSDPEPLKKVSYTDFLKTKVTKGMESQRNDNQMN